MTNSLKNDAPVKTNRLYFQQNNNGLLYRPQQITLLLMVIRIRISEDIFKDTS